MIKKLLSTHANSISSGAFIIAITSMASRLLGVLRDRILAAEVGPGNLLDAYFTAFRIPDTVYNLIVLGALSAGFIPVFLDCLTKEGKEKAWEVVNNALKALVLVLAVVCAVLFVLTPWLARLIAPGFDVHTNSITITMTRIMLLSPIFFGMSSLFGGVLQSLRLFFVYSIAPIFYNIGIIVGALYFVPVWGISGLAFGVILGAFLHMAVQYPAVREAGFRFSRTFNVRDVYLRKISILMVPRTLSLAVTQLNFFIVTIFGSMLPHGSISVFNLANNLQSFPLGIFAISLAVAAFPILSSSVVEGKSDEFLEHFVNTTKQILFFIIPASVLLIVLRAQIVRVVFGSGVFDWTATRNTLDALAFFSVSLFAQSLTPLLARSFYAYQDTKTPFWVGLGSVILNIVLCYFFVGSDLLLSTFSPVVALVLAFSLSQIFQCLMLWILLRMKISSLHEFDILASVFKTSMAAFTLGLSAHLMKYLIEPLTGTQTFVGIFLQGVISGIVGIGFFILVCIILRSDELHSLLLALKRHLFREAVPMREAIEEAEEK